MDNIVRGALKDEVLMLTEVSSEVDDIYKGVKLSGLLSMVKGGAVIDSSLTDALGRSTVPSQKLWVLLGKAVKNRVLTTDEIVRLLDPTQKFTDSRELEARAVDFQRKQMNTYWDKESKRFKDDVAKSVRESIRKGHTPQEAARVLTDRIGVGSSRATLIATDQLLTASSTADRRRQKQLGIRAYTWQTVGDGRVREEHAIRNGQDYLWSAPSERPGEAIRCRCRGIPVLD